MIHHVGEIFGAGMSNQDAATFVEWGANNIVTGGDLAFFVKGLTDAVAAIKAAAGKSNGDGGNAGSADAQMGLA
jgi:hypothetical protein